MTLLRRRPANRLIVAGAMVIGCSLVGHAHTHHDPDGSTVDWYPQECCGEGDCRPVATLKSAPQGLWLTTVDGQTVLIGPRDQRRPSGDARWHVCLVAGERDYPPQVACIFEPSLTSAEQPRYVSLFGRARTDGNRSSRATYLPLWP
jgi:hypothetical protein